MKKLYFVSALGMFQFSCTLADAQKISGKKVTEPVTKRFTTLYPGASEVKWEITRGHNYQASFLNKNREVIAIFDDLGNMLQTETKIGNDALPKTVLPDVTMNYPGLSVKQAYTWESGGELTYMVDVSPNPKGIVRLIFDHYGNFRKNTTEEIIQK